MLVSQVLSQTTSPWSVTRWALVTKNVVASERQLAVGVDVDVELVAAHEVAVGDQPAARRERVALGDAVVVGDVVLGDDAPRLLQVAAGVDPAELVVDACSCRRPTSCAGRRCRARSAVSISSGGATSGGPKGASRSSSGRRGRTGRTSLLAPPVNTVSVTGSGDGHTHGQ